jgi:membrane protease YdiL (CAAX protease family)
MTKAAQPVSGLQIALLVFAVFFIALPVTKYSGPWSEPESQAVGRAFMFGTALAVLFGIAPIRRACARLLAVPIPAGHRTEIAGVFLLQVLSPLAFTGAIALIAWLQGGGDALAARMHALAVKTAPHFGALPPFVLVMKIPIGILVGPLVEELLFRGFMYPAWARQFGWFVAMLLTSAVFAFYHPFLALAFMGSVLSICLFRRTGSLRAPLVVHCSYNAMLVSPQMGHLIFNPVAPDAARLLSWWPHLVALGVVAVLLPAYVWMARDPPPRTIG